MMTCSEGEYKKGVKEALEWILSCQIPTQNKVNLLLKVANICKLYVSTQLAIEIYENAGKIEPQFSKYAKAFIACVYSDMKDFDKAADSWIDSLKEGL